MSKPIVDIKASYAGQPLSVLKDLISKRMKYLNETSFQASHAIAENALLTIRTITRVCNPNRIMVTEPRIAAGYYASWHTTATVTRTIAGRNRGKVERGKVHRQRCIRDASGHRVHDIQGGENLWVWIEGCSGVPVNQCHVYEFYTRYGSHHLICAPSVSVAKMRVRKIVARNAVMYAGLARAAVSQLRVKANNKGTVPTDNFKIASKSQQVTSARDVIVETSGGNGRYELQCLDDLRYAVSETALKGGRAAINLALKKAANKSVSTIQHRCKNLLLPGELPIPFPEVTKRRRAV